MTRCPRSTRAQANSFPELTTAIPARADEVIKQTAGYVYFGSSADIAHGRARCPYGVISHRRASV